MITGAVSDSRELKTASDLRPTVTAARIGSTQANVVGDPEYLISSYRVLWIGERLKIIR